VAELIQSILSAREKIETFQRRLLDPSRAHGSRLNEALAEADRQVLDLYCVTEKRFQVRADNNFVKALETAGDEARNREKLAWKSIPFEPRGFGERCKAQLLGGDSVSELLCVV